MNTHRLISVIGRASLLALLAATTFSCATSRRAAGPIELFNGKDLAGWKHVLADPALKMEDVWSVKDGSIVCKGEPLGFIYKGPEVTNFRLVAEYRWQGKPGNSGLFSRITPPFMALPRTIEVQLAHGSAGDVMGLQGKSIASGQPRFFEVKKHAVAGDIAGVRKLSDQENAAGEWNRVEILANGPRYQVWVNGRLVNEVDGVEVNRGPIGLQSEGEVVQFRRVTLTPMD